MNTDSDCAGCVLTRKTTTGAHLFHGVNLFCAGIWTQGTRSFSVAESEFHAGAKGASILLWTRSMVIDIGENVAQCVFWARTAVRPRASCKGERQDGMDICIVPCCGQKNVWILAIFARRSEKESTALRTMEPKR